MKSSSPIGIFDSGVGGTSIWQEIHQLLPLEHTIYLADSKHAPYGHKSKEEIILLSKKNTEVLIRKGCKIIVVACNTATTNAISELRANYDIPFIGIEPAIKPAALGSKTKKIGILATKGTLSSSLFHETTKLLDPTIKITEVIGEGLVPLIENGELYSEEMTSLLKKLVTSFIKAKIDYLVLGCSHYPYLIPQLKELLHKSVHIIDSGAAVAKQAKAVLEENQMLQLSQEKKPDFQFYTNAKTETLENLLKDFSEKIKIKQLNF